MPSRTFLTPTSDHIPPLLWTIQDFHPTSRLATHCLETSSLSSPCSLSSDPLVFLLFLQPARSAPSLGLPALDPLPQVTVWPPPSCHSDPVRHQLLREGARMSPLSHPPHKNRSPTRAGPCPPAAQAPTRIGHIETWEVRPATGDTRRVGISDPGARLPSLASGANRRCSLDKLHMIIAWVQTGLSNSNF